MLAIVMLTYKASPDVVAAHRGDHRAYMAALHARGKLVASGPLESGTGGALLVRATDEEELDELLAADPFRARGVADYAVHVWRPTIGLDRLEP